MPVHKCPNGKFRIGNGECMFSSKEKAEAAYKAYLDKKNEEIVISGNKTEIDGLLDEIYKEIDDLYAWSNVLHSLKTVIEYYSKK